MTKRYFYFFLGISMLLASENAMAQNRKYDSVTHLLATEKVDTTRINLMISLGSEKYSDTMNINYLNEAIALAQKVGFQKGMGDAYQWLGLYYFEYDEDYAKSSDYLSKSLRVREQLNDKRGMARLYNDIALVESSFKNYDHSFYLLHKAEAINLEIKNYKSLESTYDNEASNYAATGKLDSALLMYRKAISLCKEHHFNIALPYFNTSGIYLQKNNFDSARYFNHLADSVYVAHHADGGKYWTNMREGQILFTEGNFKKAIPYLLFTYTYAEKDKNAELLFQSLPDLAKSYAAMNNYSDAYAAQKELQILKDSLKGPQTSFKIMANMRKLEDEQRVEIARLAEEKKEAQVESDKRRKNMLLSFTIGVLSLVVLFSGFLFNRFRVTQKQKLEIEKQKNIVEEKQKEILDSIRYAKRIQQSLFPTEKYIDKQLRNRNKIS